MRARPICISKFLDFSEILEKRLDTAKWAKSEPKQHSGSPSSHYLLLEPEGDSTAYRPTAGTELGKRLPILSICLEVQ